MLAAIDKGLKRVGVSVEDQKKKMVSCNFDGAHLENASTGKKEDAAKATGILKVLKSEQLVKYLHFMIDVTLVLSRLSVQFQKDDITINEVVCRIEIKERLRFTFTPNGKRQIQVENFSE